MALHVTQVASPLLAVPSAVRRPVTGATSGQPAANGATATTAAQGNSNFLSMLASSSAAEDPAATAVASAAATGTAAASSPAASVSGLSDFELLFGGANYNPADPLAASSAATTNSPSAAEPAAPPTAQSVFGPNVWVTDPIGLNPDGSSFEYNPIYFATESTAQTVAQMVGGSVTTENVFTKPGDALFVQQQPNYMVQMPNGAVINPGLVASFYTFGFSQSQIDTMISQEVANTPPPVQTT
jgi:hypothetical protein